MEHLISTSPEWRRAADDLTRALTAVSEGLAALCERPEVMPADVIARFDDLLASQEMAPVVKRARRPAAGRRRTWRRWAAPLAIAAATMAFFALGRLPQFTLPLAESPGAVDSAGDRGVATLEGAGAPEPVPTSTTGRQYNRATLREAQRMTYSADPHGSKSGEGLDFRPEAAEGWQRLSDPAALRSCLNVVTAVLPGKATHVEYAFFDGKPALVISITSLTSQWKFVAGAACGIAGPDELYRTPL